MTKPKEAARSETPRDRAGTSADADGSIPRNSLTTEVAKRLRERIIRGELREGEQLRQDLIASWFQVSRIPVREAFRQLEAEGLITIVAHRGAVVSALSVEEIEELFEIRSVLESTLLKKSIPNLTDEDFRRAEKIQEDFDRALAEAADIGTWGELNWKFHSALYAGARRPHFLRVIQTVNYNADRYVRLHLSLSQEIRRAKEEHHAILEACKKRDVPGACQLLERHIAHACESLSDIVRRHREQAAPLPPETTGAAEQPSASGAAPTSPGAARTASNRQ